MSAGTKIEWCDATFNPWIGCAKVSPGCANCYAESDDKRRKWTPEGWGAGKPRKLTSDANWRGPVKWDRDWKLANDCPICRNQRHGGDPAKPCEYCVPSLTPRPRVFCASLADWLDDEVPIEWLARLLALIHDTPHLDWLLLTKRPQNWRARMSAVTKINDGKDHEWFAGSHLAAQWIGGTPPPNVWLGTTAEDQARANERVPLLLSIPAKVRFLSCEPLLSRIDIREGVGTGLDVGLATIDWVIAGGESGPNARPMNPDWVRSLRFQCATAEVPFFFKQHGEWVRDSSIHTGGEPSQIVPFGDGDDRNFRRVYRVGKHRAGRLLDGREHSEWPA